MPEFVRRKETKYKIDELDYHHLRTEVARRLPLFEFKPNRPFTYITTIYFDTKSLKFFNRARKYYDDSIKLRVKEYYYETEDHGTEFSKKCFVEIKQRVNGEVYKKRIRIPKDLLNKLFDRVDIWEELVASDPGIEFQDSSYDVYRELQGFLQAFKVSPHSVINYRRVVYQKHEERLRITFDDKLQVYRPIRGLYDTIEAMTCGNLGEHIEEKIVTQSMSLVNGSRQKMEI